MRWVGRLQADSTRVVHDAFANKHNMLLFASAFGVVRQFHHAWRFNTSLVHTNHAATTHLKKFFFVVHRYFEASLCRNFYCLVGEVTSGEIRRWSVCQIARHAHCIGDNGTIFHAS